jgi:hypothetical protein
VAEKKAAAKKPAAKKVSAPKPTEPKAVEVSPADAPTIKVFDKEYEVTPEGGHRRKV